MAWIPSILTWGCDMGLSDKKEQTEKTVGLGRDGAGQDGAEDEPFDENKRPQSYTTGQDKIEIAKLLFRIPRERLPELTRMPIGMLLDVTMMDVLGQTFNKERIEKGIPLSAIFTELYRRGLIGVKGWGRWEGLELAQAAKKDEESKSIGDLLKL